MAAQTITDRATDLALADVGYTERPRNRTVYWERMAPKLQGQPWCGAFVGDAYRRAGLDLRPVVNIYYVPAIISWAKRIGAWKTSNPRRGDLVCYGFGTSIGKHVGIADPRPGTGYHAIEGNTSAGSVGSQSDGGGAYRRWRGRASILGWVDMGVVVARYGAAGAIASKAAAAAASAPTTGKLDEDGLWGDATSRELQARLGVSPDGRFGRDSVKAGQRHEGTPVDGVISGQKGPRPSGIVASAWQIGTGGSSWVRQIERNLGLPVTGQLTRPVVKAIQAAMNRDAGAFVRKTR